MAGCYVILTFMDSHFQTLVVSLSKGLTYFLCYYAQVLSILLCFLSRTVCVLCVTFGTIKFKFNAEANSNAKGNYVVFF